MPEGVDELKFDWYAVLGCNSSSTKSFIEKAARKLFLKYHPDKTNDPKAPELFLQVQKAKEILLDDTKRKAIDDAKVLVTKRQDYDNERSKNMDIRRKRMRDDLDELLRKGANKNTNVGVNNDARNQKNQTADIDRLRRDGASLREAVARDAESKEANRVDGLNKERKAREKKEEAGGGLCQIKVKWKRSGQSHSEESLAQLFKKFGDVEAVMMLGDKGNSAAVLFSNESSASNAVNEYAASTEYRVTNTAKDLQDNKKRAAIYTHVYSTSSTASQQHTEAELFTPDQQFNMQESELQKQMRRAVEREEIIRSLSREESTQIPNTSSAANYQQNNEFSNINPSNTSFRTAQPAVTFSSAKDSSTCAEAACAPSLADKEADVLKRMMQAAMLRKAKSANTEGVVNT
jgi:curved DNA-binding protein CbpA